ncbi:MAG: TonB-dependent receptor [Bryobacterales bacterium]|nr:TonB-dependent receptor [Bryobacterales bacterium]
MSDSGSHLFGCLLAIAVLVIATAPGGQSQVMEGRLDVRVVDPSGQGVPAVLELASSSPQFTATAAADAEGRALFRRVPPGTYLLVASHPGFAAAERTVEVRSAVPQSIRIAMVIATVDASITVGSTMPLFEPFRPSQGTGAGREALDRALGATLGRSIVDIVTAMPGWLVEANAVLHPRGSEYDTQYVIDGMPLYDNRSIGFAPAFETSEFEAVTVLVAGIPAEYGRRLAGVIALDTRRSAALGHHSSMDVLAGGYGTRLGAFSHQYAKGRNELSVGLLGGSTDRYLDPPSIENLNNKATSGGGNLRFATDAGDRSRLTVYARANRTGFRVPHHPAQEEAGHRQDRSSSESAGQLHFQRTLSRRSLLSVRGMVRDLTSELWSNELSTPVYVLQDRGFRERAVMGDITIDSESHTIKIGGDLRFSALREAFQMAEPDELPEFDLDFHSRRGSTEASVYIQDQFRIGNFAANLGVRFDEYRLLITDRALSPRLAASYYVPRAELQIYASYDRIFQPPPHENLLLSSAAPGLGIDDVEGALAVPASRAHFAEVGFRKPIGNAVRIDAKHYWRRFENAIDDDVFLQTGLSFPITFESAEVEGTEVRLEAPRWKGISAFASYSHMLGLTRSPVTGGLFIEGGEAEELRDVATEFPISQDQRNTVAAMVRFQPHRRFWASFGIRYGSGLPVELDDDDDDDDEGEGGDEGDGDDDDDDDDHADGLISDAILNRVNFERSRVAPNLSLDLSFGSRIWMRGSRSATLQFDLRNATDRLNVINFSGLFSATALAPGRQASVQLRLRF